MQRDVLHAINHSVQRTALMIDALRVLSDSSHAFEVTAACSSREDKQLFQTMAMRQLAASKRQQLYALLPVASTATGLVRYNNKSNKQKKKRQPHENENIKSSSSAPARPRPAAQAGHTLSCRHLRSTLQLHCIPRPSCSRHPLRRCRAGRPGRICLQRSDTCLGSIALDRCTCFHRLLDSLGKGRPGQLADMVLGWSARKALARMQRGAATACLQACTLQLLWHVHCAGLPRHLLQKEQYSTKQMRCRVPSL